MKTNPNFVLFSLPEPKPEPDPNERSSNPQNIFMSFGKDLIRKANLTTTQSFYLIFTVIYMAFIIIMAASPTIISVVVAIRGDSLEQIKPPVPLNELMLGLLIWLGVGFLYFILYSIPELLSKWKKVQK